MFVLSKHVPTAVWANISIPDRVSAGDRRTAFYAAILFSCSNFAGDDADDNEYDGQSTTDKDHRYNKVRGGASHEKIY